jgi:mycothiol synthase
MLPENYTERPANKADIDELVSLSNLQSQALVGEDEETVDHLVTMWQTPGLDLDRDSRVAVAPDGSLAASVEVWNIMEPYVSSNSYWYVRPDLAGQGLEEWAVNWSDDRARQDFHRAPQGARVVIRMRFPEENRLAIQTVERCGYRSVRRLDRMLIDLSRQPEGWDDISGVSLRRVNGRSEIEKILFALWESFEDHWGHVPEPFENYRDRFLAWAEKGPEAERMLWLAAVEGDQVTAGALCTSGMPEDDQLGWVNLLGVRRQWRKRGLGKVLLLYAFHEFHRLGLLRAGLVVDADSLTGAARLYEAAGLRTVRTSLVFEKELRAGFDMAVQ